jgi:hypothetical protein
MSDQDKVRRIQELRRSSAASPVDRTESRSVARRKAIQDPGWHDADPMVMDVPKDQDEAIEAIRREERDALDLED